MPSPIPHEHSLTNPKFPNRIAEARFAARLSVEDVARRAGVSATYLRRLERGARIPGAVVLHDLARILGVLVDSLYDRDWSWARRRELRGDETQTA